VPQESTSKYGNKLEIDPDRRLVLILVAVEDAYKCNYLVYFFVRYEDVALLSYLN
jgi:hypothetical protein